MYAQIIRPYLDILHTYYAHGLSQLAPEDWLKIEEYAALPLAQDFPEVQKAVLRVAQASLQDREEMAYEFNALFVGPDELIAAPYETVYVSEERVLMRAATMSVRDAYRRAGLEVDKRNIEADDNFAYEFAFLGFLLDQQTQEAQTEFERFCKEHIKRWAPGHVAAIRKGTDNEVCLGFADLLEAVCACCCLEASEENN